MAKKAWELATKALGGCTCEACYQANLEAKAARMAEAEDQEQAWRQSTLPVQERGVN